MIWLKIENINKNLYTLKDEEDTIHEVCLRFFKLASMPNIGDAVFMNEQLLSENYEGYSNSYTFGPLDSIYGKANVTLGDIDVIKLCVGDETILLKRLYG